MSLNFSRFAELGKKIVAVGRNYREHAIELGNAVPEKPLLFMKPASSYLNEGSPIVIPLGCTSLHHEIELGIVIGEKAKDVSEANALNYVAGYVLALDMTARDFQDVAKAKGHPWEMAKGFDTACPIGSFISKSKISDPQSVELWCKVNGKMKQSGNTKDMIFKIPYLVSYISKYFTLEPYDVILTGTPSGVGPVVEGDIIEGGLNELAQIKFNVEQKKQ